MRSSRTIASESTGIGVLHEEPLMQWEHAPTLAAAVTRRDVSVPRRVLALFVLGYGVLALIELTMAARRPLIDVVDFLFDDAYYYLGIADHLAHGAGSKFRDPLFTNGYQPLWLWLLAVANSALDLSKRALFVFTLALSHAMKLGTLSHCLFSRRVDRVWLGIAIALCIPRYAAVFSWGLETTLLLPIIPALPWLLSDDHESAWRAVWAGLCFSLLFLIRLDCVALFLAYAAIKIVKERRVSSVLLAEAAGLAATMLVYSMYNQHAFGSAVPISGLAKGMGARFGENWSTAKNYLWTIKLPLLVLVTGSVVRRAVPEQPPEQARSLDRVIVTLLLASAIVTLYYALFSGWPLWGWYYWAPGLLLIFGSARLLAELERAFRVRATLSHASRWLCGSSAALSGVLALSFLRNGAVYGNAELLHALSKGNERLEQILGPWVPKRPSFNKASVLMSQQFLSRQPALTVVMGDRAGGLGYWMPAADRLIHTEGIVGSREFLEARRAGRGVAFIDELKPDLYVSDRERYFELQRGRERVLGFAEPIQGRAMHQGVMLFCFPASARIELPQLERSQHAASRMVFAYAARVPCPPEFEQKLAELLAEYDGLRRFSLPSEYGLLATRLFGILPPL